MSNRRNALRALDRALIRGERVMVGVGILAIAAISIANVLARNLLGGSIAFAQEVNQALMVWITFAGVGLGARHARHIRMSAFHDQLRGRARKLSWMAITAGTSALLFAFAALALRYVITTYSIGGVTPALRVPLWLVYAVAPLGLAIGGLEYALTLVRNASSPGTHFSFDVEDVDDEAEAEAEGRRLEGRR